MSRHTKTQKNTEGPGNTYKDPRSRNWFFTYNNYDQKIIDTILHYFKNNKYMMQEEIGEEKTPHLQGCVSFPNAKKFSTLVNALGKGIHLEICKRWKKSLAYCSKPSFDGALSWSNGVKSKVIDPLQGIVLYKYQQEVIDLIKQKADSRTIHWYWEPDGNAGKTALAKSICIKNTNAIYVRGRSSDIKYAVSQHLENADIEVLIIDLPRTSEGMYVSYQAIEEIKNGIFFTTKYEAGMCVFNPPHVIIFANGEPDCEKLSKDRWNVKRIKIE